MGQGLLPFEYRQESRKAGGTAMAGMPLFLELACATGLWASVRYHVLVCSEKQGWTDEQVVPPGGWRPVMREVDGVAMPSGREWAELCYVPGQSARRKDDPDQKEQSPGAEKVNSIHGHRL